MSDTAARFAEIRKAVVGLRAGYNLCVEIAKDLKGGKHNDILCGLRLVDDPLQHPVVVRVNDALAQLAALERECQRQEAVVRMATRVRCQHHQDEFNDRCFTCLLKKAAVDALGSTT